MNRRTRIVTRLLLPLITVALPAILLITAVRTLRELDEQKSVYLRVRAATLAGRLETLPPGESEDALEVLAAEEPGLIDLELLDRPESGKMGSLAPLWNGQELFRAGFPGGAGGRVFRAWVPFHSGDRLRLARIDLDAGIADFLVVHAHHNVIVASVGGLVLVLLSLYAVWSARRTAALELRQLELEHLAHIGKMSAVLAHEIRNPLGTIKGFVQLAAERAGASVNSLLEPVLAETTRLENLVNDLLLYGRPPSPDFRPSRWSEIRDPLLADAAALIAGRGIRFETAGQDGEWQTDPGLLRQALLNLIRNAVEAAADSEGAEVRLEFERDGSAVVISVRDNGPGIPDEVRARLFEPFFTTKAFGTGLGLSITRRLAGSLGGTFDLKPSRPRGAVAVLRFPARPKQA